jgi:hypothetical protein
MPSREEWERVHALILERKRTRGTFWDRLHEGTHWLDGDGKLWKLENMRPDHRRNVLAHLEKRAKGLKSQYEWSLLRGPQPHGDAACDAFDAGMTQLMEQKPITWLNEQPLVIRLRELIAEDDMQNATWGGAQK